MKIQESFLTTPGTILPSFVGRRREINVLNEEFFNKQRRVLNLHGLAGIGKSSLAAKFAQDNKNKFPGGIVSITAQFSSPIQMSLNKDQPSLIVWDDIDFLQDSSTFQDLEATINNFPKSLHLLLSRYKIDHGIIESYVNLGGLTQAEMHILFKRRLEGHPEVEFDKFWELFLGNPLAAELAFSTIRDGIYTANDILNNLKNFEESGLFGPNGQPLSKGNYDSIITDISSVNDDLLRELEKDPKLFYHLSSRKFEEVIAEIMGRMGYEITLTPATRDGGKDIYAAKKDNLGTFLYIVECKKYSPDNHVGVGLIRELYGVVQAERATAGILATTSFFSKPAQDLQESIKYHVSLRDYIDIQKWLRNIINV